MNIKQMLSSRKGEILTLNDSYLMGASWMYRDGILIRNQRVLLGTEAIPSVSCVEKENSLLFTLENKAKIEMSYKDEEIILQFPDVSLTKHYYKNYTWS